MKIGRFACPGCGQKIEASLISLASKVECPNCGEKFGDYPLTPRKYWVFHT